MVDRKKLGGILVETKVKGRELGYAVIGVGLNVNLSSDELPTVATSIFSAIKKRSSLEKTLSSILTVLEGHYETLEDPEAVVSDWWNHCTHRMKWVTIETNKGMVQGKCVGIIQDGSIIIQTEKGNAIVADGTLRIGA